MVLRRCERLLRDPEKAADAMHDVFVEILRRKETLTDSAPSSLLLLTATNLCLNRLRSARRKPENRDEELLMEIASAEDPAAPAAARSLLAHLFDRRRPPPEPSLCSTWSTASRLRKLPRRWECPSPACGSGCGC